MSSSGAFARSPWEPARRPGPATTTAPDCLCFRWSHGSAPRDTMAAKKKGKTKISFQRNIRRKRKENTRFLTGASASKVENLEKCKELRPYPLIVLFLGDLLDLVEQLADAQLQLGQFLLLCHLGIVDGVLADLNVQVDAQLRAAEPVRGVRVQAQRVLARRVRHKGDRTYGRSKLWRHSMGSEWWWRTRPDRMWPHSVVTFTCCTVDTRQNFLILGISYLGMHANTYGHKILNSSNVTRAKVCGGCVPNSDKMTYLGLVVRIRPNGHRTAQFGSGLFPVTAKRNV